MPAFCGVGGAYGESGSDAYTGCEIVNGNPRLWFYHAANIPEEWLSALFTNDSGASSCGTPTPQNVGFGASGGPFYVTFPAFSGWTNATIFTHATPDTSCGGGVAGYAYAGGAPVWKVLLNTDVTQVTVGHGAVLTAVSNYDVGYAGYSIVFFDQTTGQQLGYCTGGMVCRLEVYIPGGPAHTFFAAIGVHSTTYPLPSLQATSNAVTIDHAPWAVSLDYDSAASQLVATTNQDFTSSPYAMQIFNADDGGLFFTCHANPCRANVASPDAHYVALIDSFSTSLAGAANVQARSGVVLAPTGGPTGDDGNCQCAAADPVNTATGMLHETAVDLSVPERGPALMIGRSYLEQEASAWSPMGYGWRPSSAAHLRFNAPGSYGRPVALVNGDASPTPGDATGVNVQPPGFNGTTHPTGELVSPAGSLILGGGTDTPPPDDAQIRVGYANLLYSLQYNVVTSIQLVDEQGARLTFEPGGNGQFTALSNVVASLRHNTDGTWTLTRGHRETLVFNPLGWLLTDSDNHGNSLVFSYDSNGRLATETDDAGRALTYTYDGNGRVTAVADSAGRTASYSYNAAGELASATDPSGATTQYGYDGSHRLLTITDPRQHTTTNTFDTLGHVTQQVDRAGRTTGFAYTFGSTDTTTVTEPNGSTTVMTYDDGELTSLTRAQGTPQQGTWSYAYDPTTFQATSVTDPLQHHWTFTYDADGNRLSATDPLNHNESWTYNGFDEPLTHVDRNGVTTTMTYDASGNLLSASTPLNGSPDSRVVTYHYDDTAHPDDITSITDARGRTSQFSYDTYGEISSATDPDGHETTYDYTCSPAGAGCRSNVGWVYASVPPRGNAPGANPATYTTRYVRDDDGRVLTATDPLGHSTASTYDANGNLATVEDAKSQTTSYSYNEDDQPTAEMRPDHTSVTTGYDDAGNVHTQTDGAQHTTTYTYDPLNAIKTVTDPKNRTTSYTHDAAGRLAGSVDAQNRATAYGYDDAGRLTSVQYSDPTTPDVGYGYDNDGRRTSMSDGSGGSSYIYDSLGRLTEQLDGAGHDVRYTYDLAGNVVKLTYPDGRSVDRAYDDAGQFVRLTDWNGGIDAFDYDADGNLTAIHYPNGVTESTSVDAAGLVASVSDATASSTLASYTYGRDPVGLVASVTPTGSTGQTNETYGHSALNQLTSYNTTSHSGTYGYDSADNLTALADGTAQTFDDASQLLTSGSRAYSYSATGDRVGMTAPGGTTTYGYDQASRMTSMTGPAGATQASYRYDGDGLRVGKTVNGTNSAFTWDMVTGQTPLLLSDGDATFVYGPNDMPLEQVHQQGIELVGSDGKTSSIGTTTSTTLTVPASARSGDVAVVVVSQDVSQVSSVAGFTAVPGCPCDSGSTSGESMQWFQAPIGANPPPQVTVNTTLRSSGLNPGHNVSAILLVYRGVDTQAPIASWGVVPTTGTLAQGALAVAAPSLTAGSSNNRLLYVGGVLNDAADPTWSVPSGMTSRGSAHQALNTIVAADQPLSSAGATGTRTGTLNSGNSSVDSAIGLTAVLRAEVTYIHHDQYGSTRLLTDTLGNVAGSYSFDPYGYTTAHSGADTTTLLFNGQYRDSETGNYYLRARYYDPTSGQFLTRDPLEAETRAPYSYAGSDPLDNSDSSGMDWCVGDVCLGFHPRDAINPIVNFGRGASFGYSDKIANWISPGASCTVDQSAGYQALGAAATVVATLGAAGAAGDAAGEARTYIDLTRGGSIRNVGTDATHSELTNMLTGNGWTSRVSKDGAVQIFEKNGAKYVLRNNAGSYSGWTADFTPAGSTDVTLKLRLGYAP